MIPPTMHGGAPAAAARLPAPEPGAREPFRLLATVASSAVGSPWAFCAAIAFCVAWAAAGPFFGYSDACQLVINSVTNIVTFIIVFLIQYSQNRDSKAIHIKLDELLRGVQGARTGLVDLEQRSDEELRQLKAEFEQLREAELRAGRGRAPA